MNRLSIILALCLCVFVALFGVGYLVLDSLGDDETTTESTPVTEDVAGSESIQTESDEEKTTKSETTKSETSKSDTTKEKTTVKVGTTEYEYAYAGFNPSLAVINSEKWNLLLVNQNYILPDDFTVKTATVKGGSYSLDYRVVPYYNAMITAAEADGISLYPVSAYRTVERQRTNFEKKIKYYSDLGYSKAEATRLASQIVLMPATSEHNAGLAVDFGTNGSYTLDENFANTKAFKWLEANAVDYGFILRYEKDTQHITKVTYEPWHWRYVGEKAAKEIKASGVTLEEYLGVV